MVLSVKPVWADSLGAKSFCTLVRTPDISILIDPGVAIMHPSFPASWEEKEKWVMEGYEAIVEASRIADVVVISHYHYDHYTTEDSLYRGKAILAKSPNEYINDSQRARALRFFDSLFAMEGIYLDEVMRPQEPESMYPDPLSELPHAMSRDYGDYARRKKELLEKGRRWFLKRVEKWRSYKRIPEHEGSSFRLRFADGREFSFGDTRVRFTKPMFHGIEFSRVGWVLGLVVASSGKKVLFSSDVNGPIIEDYADWIVEEAPDVVLLDGPATYTLGYMLNRTNLKRAVENIKRVINVNPELLLLDHHLPREPRFKDRLREVYELAERKGVRVETVAEYYGKEPVVLSAD